MVARALVVACKHCAAKGEARLSVLGCLDPEQQAAKLWCADRVVPTWWRLDAERLPHVTNVLHVVRVVDV